MNLADPMTNQAIGMLAGALAVSMIWMAKHALTKGRPLIIKLPGTQQALADVRRQKLTEGMFTRKKGDEGQTFIAAGMAAYPSNVGPIHILTDYGANLIAPSKDHVAKTIEDTPFPPEVKTPEEKKAFREKVAKMAQRFLVWDPLIYWRACKENDTEDYYAAQQDKPHWMEKIAPYLMVSVLGLVALVGFMLWKLMPIIQGAA